MTMNFVSDGAKGVMHGLNLSSLWDIHWLLSALPLVVAV